MAGRLLGLTGVLGSGKSTGLRFFAALGWQTQSADEIVRELIATDAVVRSAFIARWGDEVLSGNKLDRQAIAKIIFSKAEEKTFAEEVLHPLVRQTWLEGVAKNKEENWIIEIPLLFEKQLQGYFEKTINVSVSENTQRARMANRSSQQTHLEERVAAQMKNDERNALADFVISNEGDKEFLHTQVVALHSKLS